MAGGQVRQVEQRRRAGHGEPAVVALAVEGNANRQIAELLFVSVKAVEWHLRNAYAKLGVANRRQLAGRVASGEVPGIASLETN